MLPASKPPTFCRLALPLSATMTSCSPLSSSPHGPPSASQKPGSHLHPDVRSRQRELWSLHVSLHPHVPRGESGFSLRPAAPPLALGPTPLAH